MVPVVLSKVLKDKKGQEPMPQRRLLPAYPSLPRVRLLYPDPKALVEDW